MRTIKLIFLVFFVVLLGITGSDVFATAYASSPGPADGETDVAIETNLTWTRGDGTVADQVYFGTDPYDLPLVTTQAVGTECYHPGDPNLIPSTAYYWQIVEVNDPCEYPGPIWSFSTVPGKATVLFPLDGAVISGQEFSPDQIYTMLEAEGGPTTESYECFFSDNREDVVNREESVSLGAPPDPDQLRYYVGFPPVPPYTESLVRETTYYWCIDGSDALGNTFGGDIWQFSIQGYKAFDPDPFDGAVVLGPDVLLSWEPGMRVTEHDVYLGTDINSVPYWIYDFIFPPPGYIDTVEETCILVTGLSYNTRYYWRVDEVYNRVGPSWPGEIYKGDVWSFTTEAQRIFVDTDAGGSNDGSSWENAYTFLQDALADANSLEKPVEIWVAEGIYTPDSNLADPNGSGDRTATFQLISGVTVKGGYAGFSQPNPDARDIELYETILSGDLYGDDGSDFANNGENSYHVVTGNETDETAVLDGFTVTGGNANGSSYSNKRGGGMYCDSDSTLTNCTFIGNSADWGGGGMSCGPTWCCVTYPTVTNCTFKGNSAGEEGGGMRVGDSDPKLTNCKISGNSAGSRGGGVMFGGDTFSSMVNCLINGNSADWGGGIYGVFCFQWTMTNCTVSGNSATERGGGMYNQYDCHMTLTNCVLWMNQDSGGLDESAQVDYEPGEAPVVNYSCIQGWTGALGGNGNINEDPRFAQLGFWDVNGVWIDGDYHLLADSSCIDAGNNSVPNLPDTDLDGHPRIIDGDCNDTEVVDMGAYEFNYAYRGDLDYNCRVNFVDFSIFGLAWMTEESEPNWDWVCDINDPPDGYIDWRDAAVLCDNWLAQMP
jgi:hypothetical protein